MNDVTLEEKLDSNLAKMLEIYWKLGPNAKLILLQIARRLDKGREHGDWQEMPNLNMFKEATEELLDAIVYLTAELNRKDIR